jgi:hypothetical protein
MSQSTAVKSYTPIALKAGSEQIIFPPVITLKGSNGQYASRIYRTTDSIEFAKTEVDQHCYFRVHQLADNKIALKADNGCWLSRVFRDDCHRIEAVKREIDIHCQFQVFQGKENEIYLKADNGYFLSRIHRNSVEYVEAAKAVLDSHCLLIVGEPLLKKEILNIDYKLNEAEIEELDALVCLNTTIKNEGVADVTQTLQYTYSKSEVGTWNNSAGIEIGVSTTFKAGVPFFEGSIQISANASYTHEWGGSSGTEKNISSSTQVVVPSKTTGKAKVLIRRAIIDIPFTYKVRRTFLNGIVEEQTIKTGKYRNVESYFVDVQTYDFKRL